MTTSRPSSAPGELPGRWRGPLLPDMHARVVAGQAVAPVGQPIALSRHCSRLPLPCRDVFPLQYSPATLDAPAVATAADGAADPVLPAPYTCPITSLRCDRYPFAALRPCGHVLAERALKEAAADGTCPICGAAFSAADEDVVPLVPSEEQLERLQELLPRRRKQGGRKDRRGKGKKKGQQGTEEHAEQQQQQQQPAGSSQRGGAAEAAAPSAAQVQRQQQDDL